MPSGILLQTCRRVGSVGLVATGLWSFSLVMNSIVARLLGHPAMLAKVWPRPGLPIALIGLALSLLLVYLAGRLSHRPQLLLNVSAGFLVLTCLLVGIIAQWAPPQEMSPRISWLCVLILSYPAIVPAAPGRTLWVSLLAASMEPLALGITELRGVPFEHSLFYYTWDFLPTYACAVIAVVPAKIIRGLGQQVRRARELGSYRLEEVLGKGGMGEVYRASHQMLARPAAVKLIRSDMLGGSSENARVVMERFRREAEAAASLRSPHTINLYDFGAAQDGTFFLVMELLEGIDLEVLVERFGPLPPERTAYLLSQVCESLEEAHVRGLIHRDIKPSNIFACRVGLAVDFVKVLDFGLVKARGEGERNEALLTAPGATAGTPAYIAPEVVRGDAVIDHRVDIYALGCVAYWLLTGRLVFEASNALQLMFQHAQKTPVPPSQRIELAIPPAFDELVLACLAKRPEDRPASASEVARRLATVVSGERWTPERALHWWERHHPESARPAPTSCGGLTLSRLGSDWSLEEADSLQPEGATA